MAANTKNRKIFIGLRHTQCSVLYKISSHFCSSSCGCMA